MFKRIFLRKCEKAIQKNINVVEKIHLKDVDVWKDGSNIKVDFNGTLTLSKEDLKKWIKAQALNSRVFSFSHYFPLL